MWHMCTYNLGKSPIPVPPTPVFTTFCDESTNQWLQWSPVIHFIILRKMVELSLSLSLIPSIGIIHPMHIEGVSVDERMTNLKLCRIAFRQSNHLVLKKKKNMDAIIIMSTSILFCKSEYKVYHNYTAYMCNSYAI